MDDSLAHGDKSWCSSRALAALQGRGETVVCKKWQNEE